LQFKGCSTGYSFIISSSSKSSSNFGWGGSSFLIGRGVSYLKIDASILTGGASTLTGFLIGVSILIIGYGFVGVFGFATGSTIEGRLNSG
jgi:hypothetical protein